jgi:hypothetical protein
MVPEQAENQSCDRYIVTVIHAHEPRGDGEDERQ